MGLFTLIIGGTVSWTTFIGVASGDPIVVDVCMIPGTVMVGGLWTALSMGVATDCVYCTADKLLC